MERILIVDDNPKNIQLLGNVLTENNYDVEYALNGKDALSILETDDFDLILMDVMMPDMDGFTTCKKVKQMKGKSEIPLIFLTAMNDSESISQGFEVGGVDYLTKPFNTNELLARINTHVSLKKSKDALNELNLSLEEKVKARTAEIAVMNEKLIKANNDLAVLDQSKSEFLNIINHEIRTPLNGIIGFTQVLKERIKDEAILNLINVLDNSSKRMEQFSYLALNISNLNLMGEKSLSRIELDVKEEISKVIDFLKHDLENKNLKLEFNAENANLKIDKKHFSLCVKTILSNAIHHSPPNSKIEVQGELSDKDYLIKIEDEGDGFPEVLLESGIRAFITQHIDKNPGLELYLCKLIVENHKGEINIKNQQGAVVEVVLPLK